jgi:hypothetical protein
MVKRTATTLMELDFDDSVVRGLQRYVHLVSQALGIQGECWYVQADGPASAYIALDGRLPRFPDRDVALLWDENQGWSAAIETHSGEELLVVARFGEDLLPPPETVAAWVRDLFDPHREADHLGHVDERPGRAGNVRHRIVAYLSPVFTTTVRAERSPTAHRTVVR